MKNKWIKMIGALAMAAVLSVSGTTYAAASGIEFEEIEEDTEEVSQEVMEINGEAVQTQTESPQVLYEGIEAFLFIRENTEEGIQVREVDLDQLEQEISEGLSPELAAIVFQISEEQKNNLGIADMQDMQDIQETDSQEDSNIEFEEDMDMSSYDQDVLYDEGKPVIGLDEFCQDMVYRVSAIVPQTVLIFNQCLLDDELMFTDYEGVKAVTAVDIPVGEDISLQVQNFDLEKEYAAYLEKISIGSIARSLHSTGTERQTETPVNKAPGTTSENMNGTSGNENGMNTTGEKDVTITLVPDELLEEEEMMTATYDILSNKEVTSGRVTITYDKNIMKYSDSDASDAMDNFNTNIKTPEDGSTEEGTIVMEFSSTTPQKLDGSLIDLYFDLVNVAEVGKEYALNLTVNELKNGSMNLTSEVKTERIIAEKDPDLEEDTQPVQPQSTPQSETLAAPTQTTPQSETLATQPAVTPTPAVTTNNAPKTSDEAPIIPCLLAIIGSVFIFEKARRKLA